MFDVGYNDNPTAQQFEAAYRKLLIHNDVVCSEKSNCVDHGTKILTASSRKQRKPETAGAACDEVMCDEFIFDEIFENNFNAQQFVDDSHDHSLAYMASCLESKIITAKIPKLKIKCQQCIDAFIENELMEDSFIRFKARKMNITQPCKSTYDICKFVDNYLKQCEGKSISFEAVAMSVLRNIPFETLYSSTEFATHSVEGHKYTFIKQIIEIYMKLKSVHLAKCMTTKSHDEAPMRHHFRKLVQEAGQ